MMKIWNFLIVLLLISCSSNNKEKRFEDIPLIPIHGTVYQNAEILSQGYSTMAAMEKYIILHTPDVTPKFQIFDSETGEILTGFGSKGGGPGEFVSPVYTGKSLNNDTLYLGDIPKKVLLYVRENKGVDYKYLESRDIKLKELEFVTQIHRMDNGYYVVATLSGGKEFFILLDSSLQEIKRFGKHPVEGMTSDANSFMRLQGHLASHKNSFYFATQQIPYIVRYDISNTGDVTLVWEKMLMPPKCEVYENGVSIKSSTLDTFYGMTAGEDYIFATYSGVAFDKSFTDSITACIPKTLVALSTDGDLIGKYALEFKSTALCLSEDGKKLYLWNYEPDFNIQKFDVKEIIDAK